MQPARSSRPRFPAAESPVSARRGRAPSVALGLCVLASGCFVGDTGANPLPDTLYYPTGLVRSPGGSTLYVTNSDFDLQYNGGTVLSLDLATLRPKLRDLLSDLRKVGTPEVATVEIACREVCESLVLPATACRNTNSILNPGPCLALPLSAARKPETEFPSATIGAFASGAVLVTRTPESPEARLFVPVRGDPSVTFFDITNDGEKSSSPGAFTGLLECTAAKKNTPGERCDENHRLGVDPYESTRGIILPTEPVGIAASEDGTAILVAHQTEKSVSLSINRWPSAGSDRDPSRPTQKPTLEFILGSLPDGPTDVVTVPIPALFKQRVEAPKSTDDAIDYQRGFLVTYRAAPLIDLLRVHKDESGTPRPFLTRSNQISITVNADGKDSRGIVLDSGPGSARKVCEDACAPGDAACLLECVKIPIDVYIANRTPPSLLIGRLETTTIPENSATPTGAFDIVRITDSIPLAQGASKLVVGDVIDPAGNLSRRVFAAAFDSRFVFSYDPQYHRVDAIIKTGRGPQSLVVDTDAQTGHAFLFIGHFTDSYLGVVDLDMRHPETFGTLFASVGTPTPPRDSK